MTIISIVILIKGNLGGLSALRAKDGSKESYLHVDYWSHKNS